MPGLHNTGIADQQGTSSAEFSGQFTEPVDLIVFDPQGEAGELAGPGRLADVAPTVLGYMGIEQPDVMTGQDLVSR